jgi:hypothetical protein
MPSRLRCLATVAGLRPVARAICWPVQRWRRSWAISATTAAGVAYGRDRARKESVGEAGQPFGAKACQPLERAAGRDPHRLRDHAGRLVQLEHAAHQLSPTRRRQLGVLVQLHST